MINSRNISKMTKGLKSLLLFIVSLIYIQQLNAQTDTLHYSEEIQQDSMVQYLTPLEYAFMMHEETKWMVKFNLVGLAGLPGSAVINLKSVNTSIKVDFERRIKNNFTLNTSFYYNFSHFQYYNERTELNQFNTTNKFNFLIEGRWYYNMENRVREKKQKRNLSGNYFAFGLGYSFRRVNAPGSGLGFQRPINIPPDTSFIITPVQKTKIYQAIPLLIKWGLQRRFLNRGYIDIGLKTGTNFNFGSSSDFDFGINNFPVYFLESYVEAGIALAKDHKKLQREKLCDVVRCYKSEQFILKTNLIGMFMFAILDFGTEKNYNLLIKPNIAAELKIGKSPFSLNAIINLSNRGSYSKFRIINTFAASFALEGRWYYNLKRRMIKGKSGNGLSANYIGLGAAYSLNSTSFNFRDDLDDLDFKEFTEANYYYILTGIQRLLSDHFYFDVNFMFTYRTELGYNINLGIGYRF